MTKHRMLKEELADRKNAHVCVEHATFVLGWRSSIMVLFESWEADGFVGETISDFRAWRMTCGSFGTAKRRTLTPLSYDEVKALYPHVKGKKRRVEYWQWMREMSPEGIARREAESAAEAMAAVQ